MIGLSHLKISYGREMDYEHIVRDEGDLNRIRQYIIGDNPAKWDEDKENPLWLSKGGSTRGRPY